MTYATAPVMVWHLAGCPRRESLPAQAVEAVCAMCGRTAEETVDAKKTVAGKSFTDQYLLARPDSTRTCYACSWVATGKGMDQIRMWSVVAREDKVLPPSNPKAAFATDHLHFTTCKGDSRTIVGTLADPPDGGWVVSVAESSQKHTLPYSVINRGAGRWRVRVDALDVDATPDEFRLVFARTVALRLAGYSSDAIYRLAPPIGRMKTPEDAAVWFGHAAALAPWRGSPLLYLTCLLATAKEYLDDYSYRYPALAADGSADAAAAARGAVPVGDAGLGGRGDDRAGRLVGPGADGAGDRGQLGDQLF